MLRPIALAALAIALAACSSAAPAASPRPTGTTQPTPSPVATPAPTATPAPSVANPKVVGPGEPWIVYQLWLNRADIRLIRPDGTGDHPLLAGVGTGPETLHPDWSPDGARIAYVSDNAIWVAAVDGSGARQVSSSCTEPCSEDVPAWSPDGASIAYARSQGAGKVMTHATIESITVATGAETTVLATDPPEYPSYPRWSPDGRSLVVELDRYPDLSTDASTVSASVIAVFDIASGTRGLRRLTKDAMFAAYPDWSPDGRRIVFSTYDLGGRDAGSFADPSPASDLYTIAPDGTGLTQLTHNAAGGPFRRNHTATGPLSSQPTWSPDGASIIFVQVDGTAWPGWQMARIAADGSGLVPATGTAFRKGTHPRLRPLP